MAGLDTPRHISLSFIPRHISLSFIAGVPIEQKLIKNLPVAITWTGRTNFAPPKSTVKCRRVAQVYDAMNPTLFFQQFIALIFKPLASIAP